MSTLIQYIKETYPNEAFEILKTFQRPYVGWETDNGCAVVKVGTRIILLGTNHGMVYEMNRNDAKQMIDELQTWLSEALHAITLLDQQPSL